MWFPRLIKSRFTQPNGMTVYECGRYEYSLRRSYHLVDPYREGGLIGVWYLPCLKPCNIVTFGDFIKEIPKITCDDSEVVICVMGEDTRKLLDSISVNWFWHLMDKYEKPKNCEILQYANIESCRVVAVETRTTYNIKFCEGEILKSINEYYLDVIRKYKNEPEILMNKYGMKYAWDDE